MTSHLYCRGGIFKLCAHTVESLRNAWMISSAVRWVKYYTHSILLVHQLNPSRAKHMCYYFSCIKKVRTKNKEYSLKKKKKDDNIYIQVLLELSHCAIQITILTFIRVTTYDFFTPVFSPDYWVSNRVSKKWLLGLCDLYTCAISTLWGQPQAPTLLIIVLLWSKHTVVNII